MATHLDRRVQLPPNPRALAAARAVLRAALAEVGLDSLADIALLLTTELCSNAVQHAGTEMELAVTLDDDKLTVAVTDRGPVAHEFPRASHAARPDGSADGTGLRMVGALAVEWGTRHDATGRHRVWFSLNAPASLPASSPTASSPTASSPTASALASPASSSSPAAPDLAPPAAPAAALAAAPGGWPGPQACRWLLHMPGPVATRLDVPALVTELLRRLCEVIGAEDASVLLDYGDGKGERVFAQHGGAGRSAGAGAGVRASAALAAPVLDIRLALDAPLRGRLRVCRSPLVAVREDRLRPGADNLEDAEEELARLSALRIALAIESDWLRGADRRRRSWMTYLADTSELLAQSLDVNFTAALVPQIVVPRLGTWCAVHLVEEYGSIVKATWGHADEAALEPLRSWLDGTDEDSPGALRPRIDEALRGTRPVTYTMPVEGVTVPLIARSTTLGTLTVGRPEHHSHTPEDVTLISDVARRASLAIANAQLNAAHVTVSQAFQRALLPRALPVSDQVEFAAAYLPASVGTDVGGDFYDVLELPENRWLVAVGDVCGKGAPAAARTGRVRDVLRVLIRDGCPLERAVRLLNDAMGEPVGEQQFCTLAGAVVTSSRTGPGLDLELVLAGHEKPVLVCADQSTRFIGRYGTAVGLLDEIRLHTTRYTLRRGDAMVVYTDGVTERRRGNEFFGRTRLAKLVATMAGAPAATMVAALRTAAWDFSPDPPKDDIALLVVKAR